MNVGSKLDRRRSGTTRTAEGKQCCRNGCWCCQRTEGKQCCPRTKDGAVERRRVVLSKGSAVERQGVVLSKDERKCCQGTEGGAVKRRRVVLSKG